MIKTKNLFRSSLYRTLCILITTAFIFGLLPAPVPAAPATEPQPSQISLCLIIGIVAGAGVIGTVIWQVARRRATRTS